MPAPRSLKDRLMEKVVIEGNGCWLFMGSLDEHGYGQIGYNETPIKAHRAAWICFVSPVIPEGLEICHKCDTKYCCNPSHLYLGTHADNMFDWRKTRYYRKTTIVEEWSDRPFDEFADNFVDAHHPEGRPQPSKPTLVTSDFGRKFPKPDDEDEPLVIRRR